MIKQNVNVLMNGLVKIATNVILFLEFSNFLLNSKIFLIKALFICDPPCLRGSTCSNRTGVVQCDCSRVPGYGGPQCNDGKILATFIKNFRF